MTASDTLRSLLTTQLDATVARRSHTEILRDIPASARGVLSEGLPEAYSLWQILEHLRFSQTDYLRYCTDPAYSFSTWPDDYWPNTLGPPSDAAWTNSLDRFQADLQRVKTLVNDPSVDIAGEIPHANGAGYHGTTYAGEIGSIADHNAYHLGQVVTVRRLLGVWPPSNLKETDWSAPE